MRGMPCHTEEVLSSDEELSPPPSSVKMGPKMTATKGGRPKEETPEDLRKQLADLKAMNAALQQRLSEKDTPTATPCMKAVFTPLPTPRTPGSVPPEKVPAEPRPAAPAPPPPQTLPKLPAATPPAAPQLEPPAASQLQPPAAPQEVPPAPDAAAEALLDEEFSLEHKDLFFWF